MNKILKDKSNYTDMYSLKYQMSQMKNKITDVNEINVMYLFKNSHKIVI